MEAFPVILAPVSLQPPLGHAEDIGGRDQYKKMEELQCWLIATNFLGLPSVALPTGIIDGLPTGVQLIGRRFHEDQCLDVAQAIEDEVGILVKNLWSK
jgi:amidase